MWLQVHMVAYSLLSTTSNTAIFMFCYPAVAGYHAVSAMLLFSLYFFRENKDYILCELSTQQMIHMKCQSLFPYWKIVINKIRMLSATILLST